MRDFLRNNRGSSIVEIVVALAIFSMVSSVVVSLMLGGVGIFARNEKRTQASFFLQEDAEGVRSMAHTSWNTLAAGTKMVARDSQWSLVEVPVDLTSTDFTRTVTLVPLYRDVAGVLVASDAPGAVLDPFSHDSVVRVAWLQANGDPDFFESRFIVTPADFSVLSESDWSEVSKYASIDRVTAAAASITLASLATSTFETLGTLESNPLQIPAPGGNFLSLAWKGDLPADTHVRLWLKTSLDNADWSAPWAKPNTQEMEDDYSDAQTPRLISANHNGQQWLKYKVELFGNGSSTPVVKVVEVRYQ